MDSVPRESGDVRAKPASAGPARWTRLRFVRCEACGAKALVAASQCPQCGQPFELRNSRGEPLPLSYCDNCDLYYPRRLGSCRWCGSTPPAMRLTSVLWGALTVVSALGIAWGAWTTRSTAATSPAEPTPVKEETPAKPVRADSGGASTALALAPLDSGGLPVTLTRDTALGESATEVAAPEAMPAEPAGPPADQPERVSAPAPPPASEQPRPKAATQRPPSGASRATVAVRPPAVRAPPTRRPAAVRWINATVRGWVRVRTAANHGARTVALIGPDTRVQLGDPRGDWLRLRTTGITGWVESRHFARYSGRLR